MSGVTRFARVGPPGAEHPVVACDGAVFDLSPLTADIDAGFLTGGGLATARTAARAGDLPEVGDPVDGTGQRLGAPIARPGAVVCIGMNYAAHAAESGSEPPPWPVVFLKAPNTVVGPHDPILLPPGARRVDWEVELGVVIGSRLAYAASADEAHAAVAGYVVSNDVSERAFQLDESGGQWSKGKCAETFNPLGPWLVPADEVDAADMRLRLTVSGEPRQDSSTADMIFPVATALWHLSQYMVLEPGDLVNTGTPEGVALSGRFPYLTEGDVVECEIGPLGRQRSVCRRSPGPDLREVSR